ncbi:MAG: RNA-binding protein [Gammaproteobacteria bacterium SHHR-1]|uniref:RNA recognition motif domain-containing protein n=1 Tax=Magnetovirga frankeli TaxID=947516 RepID=UPI001292D0F1|nr:RNA-binding protein [gamma proteobacterium SS-5]
MNIIITFIPNSTTLQELERFVRSGLGLPLAFWNKAKLRHCDILNILDRDTGGREAHGLAYFISDEAADQAVKALNGKKINGKPVEVRRFFYRRPGDQRKSLGNLKGKALVKDARRTHLSIRSLATGNQAFGGDDAMPERKIFEDGPERELGWEAVDLPDAADAPSNRSTIRLDQRQAQENTAKAPEGAALKPGNAAPLGSAGESEQEVIDLSDQLKEMEDPKEGK